MRIFAHRGLWLSPKEQNTLSAIERAFQLDQSVEIDIWKVDDSGKIFVGHEVGLADSDFDDVLEIWRRFPEQVLAINIKCDGLAKHLIGRMEKEIKGLNGNFFVFDMSTPERVIFEKLNIPIAYRVSEIEPYSLVENAEKIWLDSFQTDWWLSLEDSKLENLLKKSVVVSPELHGRNADQVMKKLQSFNTFGICLDSSKYANE